MVNKPNGKKLLESPLQRWVDFARKDLTKINATLKINIVLTGDSGEKQLMWQRT